MVSRYVVTMREWSPQTLKTASLSEDEEESGNGNLRSKLIETII